MMSLNLLSLLGFRLCTRLRARVEMRACRAFRKVPYLTATPYGSKGTLSSTTDLREIGGFLLSEDILKAGNYDHPLQCTANANISNRYIASPPTHRVV